LKKYEKFKLFLKKYQSLDLPVFLTQENGGGAKGKLATFL